MSYSTVQGADSAGVRVATESETNDLAFDSILLLVEGKSCERDIFKYLEGNCCCRIVVSLGAKYNVF